MTLATTKATAEAGLRWERVQGWAETHASRAWVARPSTLEECASVIEQAKDRGLTICPRGAGYSYADMILNDGQIILDTSRMTRLISWDPQTGQLVGEPGVTMAQILRLALPERWTVAACVGGLSVTLGGAVSNNVHGKDAWWLGNFGEHVVAVKLLTAASEVMMVSRTQSPELFAAVIGGLGLLGVIIEITLQLVRVPSAYVEVRSRPAANVRDWMDQFEGARGQADFAMAWVDAFAGGRAIGRGEVATARWIETARQPDPAALERSLTMGTRLFGLLPARATWSALRPFYRGPSVRLANAAKAAAVRARGTRRSMALFTEYNFVHNRIPELKQLYRPHGMVELQPLIPAAAGAKAVEAVLRLSQRAGMPSLLCGVKRHRPDGFPLSYAGDGYSLGIDIACRGRRRADLERFARELYELVASCGGTTYLAKDELLAPELFARMFPRHRELLDVKDVLDPTGLFQSGMFRRLMRRAR